MSELEFIFRFFRLLYRESYFKKLLNNFKYIIIGIIILLSIIILINLHFSNLKFILCFFGPISYSFMNSSNNFSLDGDGSNNPNALIIILIIYSIFKAYCLYNAATPPNSQEDFTLKIIRRDIDFEDEEDKVDPTILDNIREIINILNNNPSILFYIGVVCICTSTLFYQFYLKKKIKKRK